MAACNPASSVAGRGMSCLPGGSSSQPRNRRVSPAGFPDVACRSLTFRWQRDSSLEDSSCGADRTSQPPHHRASPFACSLSRGTRRIWKSRARRLTRPDVGIGGSVIIACASVDPIRRALRTDVKRETNHHKPMGRGSSFRAGRQATVTIFYCRSARFGSRLAAADGRRKARQMPILRPFRGIRGARPRQPRRGPVTLNAQRTGLLGRGAS
jgi:hypothetical protein